MSSRRWSESKFGGFGQSKKQKDQQAVSGKLQEEKTEAILWINHTLADSGHSSLTIKDISHDLNDGIVLVKIIEYTTGELVPHHAHCSSQREKLENIQKILSVVNQKGVSMTGINAEDVVRGNLKVILNLCHKIRQGLAVRGNTLPGSPVDPIQRTAVPPSPSPAVANDSLLMWAGDVLQQGITHYSELRNGRLLCYLINAMHSGAISPNVLMSNTPPQKCLTMAIYAAEKYFGITVGPYDVIQIVKGENDTVIQLLLQQLKEVWIRRNSSDSTTRKGSRNSMSPPTTNQLPIHHQDAFGRGDQGSWASIGYMDNSRQSMAPPRHNADPNHSSSQSFEQFHKLRVSSSTGHLSNYSSNTLPFQSSQSSYYGSEFGINRPGVDEKTRSRHTSVGGEPMIDSVIKGVSSYKQQQPPPSSDSTRSPRHSSITNLSQPSQTSLKQHEKSTSGAPGGNDRQSSRYSVPNSNTTVEYSFSNDLPMPVTIYRTSSRTSIHSTSSRSSLERDDQQQHITLAHLSSPQSSIPSHLTSPEYQTEKNLRDTYRRSNGGGGAGSSSGTGVSTSGMPPSNEYSSQLLDDINKQVAELTDLMSEERNVLKVFRAVAKENARRRKLEKKFMEYMSASKDTIRRYESCLLHLGKEMSRISTELGTIKDQVSAVSSLENDVIRLNAEVTRLSQKVELTQQSTQSKHNQYPPPALPENQSTPSQDPHNKKNSDASGVNTTVTSSNSGFPPPPEKGRKGSLFSKKKTSSKHS